MNRAGALCGLEAAAGLPGREIARRARIGLPYLRQVLREGAPYHTAERLARVTGIRVDAFLHGQGGGAPTTATAPGRTGGRTRSPHRG